MKQHSKAAILIVDDEPDNLMLLETILDSLKQTVIKADSGLEAIQYIDQQEFAVVILDVSMPEMSGFELAEYIRNKPEIEHTPIIFLTGIEIGDFSHFKGYELGAVDYLIKPVNCIILLSKVSVFVELFLQKQQLKQTMEEIAETNKKLERQIIKYEEVQTNLRNLAANLENLVEQRTIQLQKTNINLSEEIKQRQHTEKILRESEQFYRLILSNIFDAVLMTDEQGNFTYISPNVEMFFSYLGQDIRKMKTIGELLGENLAEMEKLKELGEITNIEREITDKLGKTHVVLVNVKLVSINGKKILYTCRDITERKQAEASLRESEEKLRNIVTTTADGLIVMNQSGYIYFVNPAAEAFFGLDANQLSEYQWNFSLNHDSTELAIEHPEGKLIFLEVKIAETSWEGEPVYLISLRDITERKQAEEALKISEKRYRNLINNLHSGVIVHGSDTKIVLSNTKASELLELSLEELLNKDAFDSDWYFLREDGTKMLIEEYPVNMVITTQQPLENYVIGIHRPNSKTLIWALVNAFGEFNIHGQINQIVVTFVDITDFKQAQEALQESKRRYVTLAQASPVGIFQTDPEGNCLYVNERWQRIAGLTWQQALGNGWSQAIHSEDKIKVFPKWEQAIRNKKPFQAEYRFQRPDGEISWVYGQVIAETDDQGRLKGFLGTITDISDRKQVELKIQRLNDELEQKIAERTQNLQLANQQLRQEIFERKQAEEALQKSEAQMRSMFEFAAIGIAFADLQGKIFDSNPALEKFLGYSSQELAQMEFTKFTHPEDAATDLTLYQDLITNNKDVYQMEKRYIRKDGKIVWGHLSVSLVRNSQGKPQFTIRMSEDISDAKRSEAERQLAEEALRENQTFLRNVIDTVPNLIFVKNRQGKYTLANQAMANIYGTTVKELENKSEADFNIIPAEVSQVQADDQQVINSLQPLLIPEQPLTLANGEVRYFQTIKTPLIFPDGNAYYILGVATDITERKQIQQEIEKALAKEKELNQLKTQFIDIVSHEFRTPLTSIFGYAELLERHNDKLSTEKKIKHLHNIKTAGKRLSDLIEDVLCISRVESGKLMFNPISINLETFCQELIEEIQIGIGQGYEIIFTQQELPMNYSNHSVSFDDKLLRHILTNLLSNAIKYSPVGSRVGLSLQYKNQQVIFEISDQGIGIPLEDRAKLFDSFYRASNVGNIPGTGLGLNIVQKYVTLHGGTIDFTSNIGVGTTFRISIPIHKNLCKIT